MEERLFWIGLFMGAYAWATRGGRKSGRLGSRAATALWHALFCFLAGFSAALVAVISVESRGRFQSVAVGIMSLRELYYSLAGGLFLAAWGGWSAWRKGRSEEARRVYVAEDLEWADTVFSAVLLASVLMYCVVQAFKIPSGSMRSTLLEGDHLFVNKFIYGVRIPFTHKRVLRLRPIKRGDVIVFPFPDDNPRNLHCGGIQYRKDFIKRVIGLPGDEIKVSAGRVYVNGALLDPEPYTQYLDGFRRQGFASPLSRDEYQGLWESHNLDRTLGDVMRDEFGPVRVPKDSYFMMGDNRDRSCDSRFWGPVPDYLIKGKAWVLYWPPSRMGLVQ